MRRTSVGTGTEWESVVGYSRAVRVGNRVYVTGTTATSEAGPVGLEDAYAQTLQVLRNIEYALGELGAGLEDVVRTRMYVCDIARDWEAVGRAHAEQLGHVRPATTMVQVSRLIADWMLVEIEADAVIGSTAGVAPKDLEIGAARLGDGSEIGALLSQADLAPISADEPVTLLTARRSARVVGVVGWECYGSDALLRSLAVVEDHRKKGVAGALVVEALGQLALQGLREVYLLTQGAEEFFARHGFEATTRAELPLTLGRSKQLSTSVCAAATAMRRSPSSVRAPRR